MASFITSETSEDSYTFTSSSSRHLSPQYLFFNTTKLVWSFTAAQYSGVNFYAVDFANAQAFINNQAYQGYNLSIGNSPGLNFVTLPAGQWYVAVSYSGSLSAGQSVKTFNEISTLDLPGGTFLGNVPMTASGGSGAWQSYSFSITGNPKLYIETEGTGGVFAIMSEAQYQSFSATYANGYNFRGYTYLTTAGGALSGAPATELEGELNLPAGRYYAVWINDTGAVWHGAAGNIWAYSDPSTAGQAAASSFTRLNPHSKHTFQSTYSNHTLTKTGDGATIQVTARTTGETHTIDANSVTYLGFTDRTLIFTDATYANLALLYQGALGRTPDGAGLNGWFDIFQAFSPSVRNAGPYALSDYSGNYNSSLSIAQGFTNSQEFINKYGQLSTNQFVTQLYRNILDRAPDPAGFNGWVSIINSGATREHVLVGFADSAESINNATLGYTGTTGFHAPWLFIA